MTENRIVKVSKFMSLVLRHNPQKIGITLDENGWADTVLLIIAFPFNIDTFFTIIEPKFSISPTTSPTKKC